MKYEKTVFVSTIDQLTNLHIGQWFNMNGQRGQYMGETKSRVIVNRWKRKGLKVTVQEANHKVRLFAKNNGAK